MMENEAPTSAPLPMHCTRYVPGDPDGCARCGERADLHDGSTDPADGVRTALAEAGAARAEHRRGAVVEMLEIERLVRLGKELGLDISEMAKLARVSRQTVYTILGAKAE